jgi:hypothetical protein
MAITIPKERASGLALIMALSSNDNNRVLIALRQAKSIRLNELNKLIGGALPSLSGEQVSEFVGTLLSLYSARTGTDTSIDEFVGDLITAAKPNPTAVTEAELRSNLTALLSVRPLSMIAKARGVHTDHENTFCTVRVLTDVRPVFDVDVRQEPVGFVVAHVLKIGYHHDGRHTSLHIAMDKSDIDNLMQALQRAKDKASTISDVLSTKCGYPILAD